MYPHGIPLPFRVSQELAKATNDWVWCGAAIEGLASAKVLEPPPTRGGETTTATTAPGQAAGQLQRRGRSTGSVIGASGGIGAGAASLGGPAGTTAVSSGWPSWEVLRSRGVETDVRELMAEARACYKKKGGVLAMQV